MAPLGWTERRRPWDAARYEVLDLETSGLDAVRDQILSVAMVPIVGGVIRYGERFASLVRPDGLEALPQDGLKAHHILPSELAGAPVLERVLAEVDRRLADAVLVVHHGAVDLPFLAQAHRRVGARWQRPTVVDTLELLARLERQRSFLSEHPKPLPGGLAAARAELGLPPYANHEALSDALATAELFLLLRQRLDATRLRQLT